VINRNLLAYLFDGTMSYSRVLTAIEPSSDAQVQVFHTRGANSKQGREKYYNFLLNNNAHSLVNPFGLRFHSGN